MKNIYLVILIFFGGCENQIQSEQNISESIQSISVKQFIWEDEARVDSYYGGNRLINTQVWYPALQHETHYEPADYYFKIDQAYKQLENWSENDYQSVSSVQTKSSINAPLRDASHKFPLILFSPSLGGNLSQYTYYAEHLAERGYVVMGINHCYESEYVIDAAGNTIAANVSFHDSLKTLDIPAQITADKYREVKGIRQTILGEDIIFGLNQLLKEPFFKDNIALNKIGAFGHSIGGAGVIFASILDDRIKAVINFDGTPPTVALQNGIKDPFLFIEDLTDYENHQGYAKMHQRRSNFCEINKKDSWRILIGGANHNSFLDANYFLEENANEKETAHKFLLKTASYTNSFFSHYFKSESINFPIVRSDSLEVIYFEKAVPTE